MVKTFSIMETQHNLARVLREVEAGHEVIITRRRKPVARMLPPKSGRSVRMPDFAQRAREIWGHSAPGQPSELLLDESRGER